MSIENHPFQYIRRMGEFNWIKLDGSLEKKHLNYEITQELYENTEETSKEIITEELEEYKYPERLEKFSMKLLEIVQINKLYKSGHYHWNPTTRTLGFIDTNKLLAMRFSALVAKGAILDAYNTHRISSEYIIGLGQEGIVLGGFLAREKSIPFTSIPYLSRKNDHSEKESELRLNGSKNITIVTDVIFSASSIKRIIVGHPDSFEGVESINLFSVFYISQDKPYHPDMLKEIDPRINYFAICNKIKIDKCKYSDDKFCDCPIYCNKLEKVHEFY